ncbi:hypothetical protein [Burkholderia territorii]|uniref:hypothetical protein n=1 Tax=Burkholderia territorii TaxID=1503055 RepID=UPI000A7AC2E8|nr:hypothetical protein [Burkholderia territorii]
MATLLENVPGELKSITELTDLKCLGIDAEIVVVEQIHRGKYTTLSTKQRARSERWYAIERVTGRVTVSCCARSPNGGKPTSGSSTPCSIQFLRSCPISVSHQHR